MSPDSPRPNSPSIASLSVPEAAAEIVRLINAKPQTPRQDEIAAVIARTAGPSVNLEDPCLLEGMSRVDRIVALTRKMEAAKERAEEEAAPNDPDYAEMDRLGDELLAICKFAWSTPPRSIADLKERAAIARYWHQLGGKIWQDDPDECGEWEDQTVAELIKAVLEFGETPAQDREYGPILGSDGKPLEFEFSNEQFANAFCPWLRMMFKTIGSDQEELRRIVRELTQYPDDPEASLLFDMLDAWEVIENKFGAIVCFAKAAWARTVAAIEALEKEDPQLSKALAVAARLHALRA